MSPGSTPASAVAHDTILVLDFGSQVTQLIARRVREAHVYSEVHPCDVSDDWVRDYAGEHPIKGVILSGSHASTYEDHELRAPEAIWELGVPVLGICYGMFTMAVQQGGQVEASTTASSATPRCGPTATPGCSRASRTSAPRPATAC